jgi:multidrug efflux pump subunit AcrA (membrane-fusion protein)
MEQNKNNIRLNANDLIYRVHKKNYIRVWFIGIVVFMTIFLFLPWTQNIKAKGAITTLMQEQRPQDINSPIPGKILKWWVKEGDFVKKGDTIIQLSEIKEEYLDPELVKRTAEQLEAKKNTIEFYSDKVNTAKLQRYALVKMKNLKVQQLKNKKQQLENKLSGENAELVAVTNEYNLLKNQYERQEKMFADGLVSQTQLQQRNAAYQSALSKKIVTENKLLQTKQDIINTEIEQNSVIQDYTEKENKVEGEMLQSLSQITTGQGEIAKLENQLSNYKIRNSMYIILAPQDGQITQAKKSGLGEILKEGERITMIVPQNMKYAVEIFVRPVDLPLVNVGQRVRLTFDGFPSIIFSGWPDNSYGTFAGKIIAVESNIGPNGKFRILVIEDNKNKQWPHQLKVGSGANGIALLKDVPIWYELWRNINGFPPEFYNVEPKE